MDITEVKTKVDANIGAGDVLTLRYQGNNLNSPPIDAVIHTYFADSLSGKVQRVNGETGVVDKTKQTVVYKLNLAVQNFALYKSAAQLPAEITFSIKDNVIQFSFKVLLPATYGFGDSFSELKNQKTLPINQLKLENSVITLRSDTKPTSHFEANLLPFGPLKRVEWLFGKNQTLTGSIDYEVVGNKQFPSINLATPNLTPIAFGVFALDIVVRLRSVVHSISRPKPTQLFVTHVELVTEFKTESLDLPVVMPLYGEEQYLLSFHLDLTRPKPPINSLKALTGFTGGSDPKQFLNPELDLGKAKLSLDSMSAVLDPYAKRLVNVEIALSLELDWSIIPNKLELEKIGAAFTINDPAAPKAENITAFLFAQLKVGPARLETSLLLPDRTLQAHLTDGSTVDVNALLATFSPSLHLPGNDQLTIYKLEVYAHLKKGEEAYSFESGVQGSLTIFKGLTLEEIYFFVAYQDKAVSDANLACKLGLTNIKADVSLLAAYNVDSGWQLDGGTGPGQTIPVGHLIKDISELFGAVSVPAVIENLSIKDLKTSFNTKSKDFHFNIEVDFADVAAILTFSNLHQLNTQPPVFEKRVTGVFKVCLQQKNELVFDVGIDLKPNSNYFVAAYNNTSGQSLRLDDLVKAMFPDAASLQLPSFSINIKDALVGYTRTQDQKNVSVFALDIGATLDLTSLGNIPLIGSILSAAKTLKLAFQLVYPVLPAGTKTFAKGDLAELNKLITIPGPRFPIDQDLPGLLIKTELRIGDANPIDFKLPVKVDNTGQLTGTGATFTPPPNTQLTDDKVNWLQLDKKFGPVQLQRAGFKFENGEITVLLDGGLTALGLEVDLMGLSVSSKITDVKNGEFKPQFSLQGLGLGFSKGGVSFAGALLRRTVTRDNKPVDEYDGLATVQAEGLRLAAIGSLSKVNDQTSLFLFAVLDYPLGGAPFFYVTGLAGGFGLNQKLVMPAVDQVSKFPLITTAQQPPQMPTDPGSAGTFIKNQMTALGTYLKPTVGQYFGCAGVEFTSFELLDSLVIVSVSFGREFELDLLGISTLVVPPQLAESEPPLAKVTLQIVASFIPDQGLAIVQGRLTADSHILDPSCHLTGGFAFATWFGPNPNAGDFVVTLGGYHPDFQKPEHYPTVPRVGVNWQISSQLSVTGGLYFALTPRALMAGGAMRAVFQASLDLGIATVDVKAWFILGADFIVYWKPFLYKAHLYIDIGIDVVIHFLGTHDIGLDAGADLQVWGPPFGGHAHVSVKIIGIKIGFDVSFGASAPKPDPLQWDNSDPSKSFRQSFLPKQNDKIVSVAISDGLVRKVDHSNGVKAATDTKQNVWFVINPKDFRVRTNTVIPIKDCSTTIQWADNKKLTDFAHNQDFGIASMSKNKDQVKTFHQITVTRNNQEASSQFVARPILTHVPGGLWAENNSDNVNDKLLIENAMVGVEIVPRQPPIVGATNTIDRKALAYTTHAMANAYADNAIKNFAVKGAAPGNDPAKNRDLWDQIQKEIVQNPARDAMLTALGFAKTDLDIGEKFSADAAYAPSYGALS